VKKSMQDYLYACMLEEGGEVIQVIGKTLRFGEEDSHPKSGNIPNRELVQREFNDFIAVAEMLGFTRDQKLIDKKVARVLEYANYAGVV